MFRSCVRVRSGSYLDDAVLKRKVTATLVCRRQHGSQSRSLRIAIIGSGPAGYYSAYRMMKKIPDAHVDMFESLPVPYGLVRFGIAPDHPEVKKSSETLDDVAKWTNFNWIGNVKIGNGPSCLPLKSIADHYDAIVFAYGASKDKKLGIPGESLSGVYSARDFVGWYNGSPENANVRPDLESGDTAVVLGQGNVALDIARVLLSNVDDLRKTDMSEQALDALSRSRISNVRIVGRRGPLQAPATIKELRELMVLSGSHFQKPEEGWELHTGGSAKSLPRQLKRIVELLNKGSTSTLSEARRTWQLQYLLSPKQFEGSTQLSHVTFDQMDYEMPLAESLGEFIDETLGMPEWERLPAIMNKIRAIKVKPAGVTRSIAASVALRSIGYLSQPLDGLDDLGVVFDEKLGIIPNDIHGRVISPDQGPGSLSAGHVPGMYCAGWVKRGPTGVIASTLDDAFRTADTIISDWQNNVIFNPSTSSDGLMGVRSELQKRGIRYINWQDWVRIDKEERRRGRESGKVRQKITSVSDMLAVIES